MITIDGSTGEVYLGTVDRRSATEDKDFQAVLKWADDLRELKVGGKGREGKGREGKGRDLKGQNGVEWDRRRQRTRGPLSLGAHRRSYPER